MKWMIRQEISADYNEVFCLIQQSFAHAEHHDGTEQELVARLRKDPAFIPELSLVAEMQGKLIGYILFTRLKIGTRTELALAPLAVLPEYQHQGVGRSLILEGHHLAAQLGYHYCVVLGSDSYYPRMGYRPATEFGITCPFSGISPANYMAICLCNDTGSCCGTPLYAKPFLE